MKHILSFLSSNPIFAISICLAVGYCIGFIKLKNFSFGATIGTLVVGFILSRFATFEIPSMLVSLFSLLFCFTIGYEAGPAFFKSLKANGIKFIIQSVLFCTCSFIFLYLIALSGIANKDTIIGIAAGALTQTSILTVAEGLGDMASIAYAVTYMTGTLLAIVFSTIIGPALLHTSPFLAVKQKLSKSATISNLNDETEKVRLSIIYPRAFRVESGSVYAGKSIEHLEDVFEHTLEVVKLFRYKQRIDINKDTIITEGDILTVISNIKHLVSFDDEYMCEVTDDEYLSIEISTKEIMITEDIDESLIDILSAHGIVLHCAFSKNNKKLIINQQLKTERGMTIKVSGMDTSIKKFADEFGYIKEIGTTTDIPFIFTALAIAIILGSLKFFGFGIGDSTCALIFGLICGWGCNKYPKFGKFPESTRWFLKSAGLNIFIAVKALTTGKFSFDSKLLLILGIGIATTLLPHIITLLFCKHALRMDDADILGGQCGSGTCTAALNSLIDASGSTVFTASYATTNAISNILLTIIGVLLSSLL